MNRQLLIRAALMLFLVARQPAAAQVGPNAAEASTYAGLLAAGANTQLSDRQGNMPLQLARAHAHREIAQMLEKAGAR